jgi:phage FluMu protein gp41
MSPSCEDCKEIAEATAEEGMAKVVVKGRAATMLVVKEEEMVRAEIIVVGRVKAKAKIMDRDKAKIMDRDKAKIRAKAKEMDKAKAKGRNKIMGRATVKEMGRATDKETEMPMDKETEMPMEQMPMVGLFRVKQCISMVLIPVRALGMPLANLAMPPRARS